MLRILFSYNDKPGSKIIRGVTQEPVSHCAVQVDKNFIMHARFDTGVSLESTELFLENNIVLYKFVVPKILPDNILTNYLGQPYDKLALGYLGLRYLFPKIFRAKHNLWQTTGMFLCTELVTDLIDKNGEDSLITPYQLYLKLNNKK